jgi:tetratricopeptide (TPR) repeat protein
MRLLSLLSLVFLGFLSLTGCMGRIPQPEPGDIPGLQDAVRANPYDPDLLTRLGMAQYRARQVREAEATLNLAVETGEAPGVAYLYLGLAREDQEDWSGARAAYLSYLDRGQSGPLKQEIEGRLTLMIQREFRARAQELVAREEELSAQDPTPESVAVLPFHLITENPDLLPLQVALADMMTTDLALSGSLAVLERAQVQSLVTEMGLTDAGYTSPETGARAGRMLRAEHVIQGAVASLPEDTLRFDTDVLNTGRGESAGDATTRDAMESLFDMEKETVFRILDILGVETTAAEREAIGQNRAANLLAFLAYGSGLMALDGGDYPNAQQFFGQALQADPGFIAAEQARVHTETLIQSSDVSPFEISSRTGPEYAPPVGAVSATGTGVLATGTTTSTSSILEATTEGVVPGPTGVILSLGSISSGVDHQSSTRNPVQESQGQEGVTQPDIVTIRITIRLPGGGD